jgi:predicted O-linked N-acetylglucosamine transferase (SPINDLY family)
MWSAVLQAQPEAKLLLRANDMAPGANIERLIARFGRELAARIDIVTVDSAAEFYAGVDVALTPLRGASPRMAAEALACGVPAVALDCSNAAQPYAAFLRDLGMGAMLLAAEVGDYARIATNIAAAPEIREQIDAAMKTAGKDGVRRFAGAIEEQAAKALEAAVELAS